MKNIIPLTIGIQEALLATPAMEIGEISSSFSFSHAIKNHKNLLVLEKKLGKTVRISLFQRKSVMQTSTTNGKGNNVKRFIKTHLPEIAYMATLIIICGTPFLMIALFM